MLILFDHGAPRGLARALYGHTVITAKARGWDRLTNGALLNAAEAAAVDLLLTTDQGIRYQQNLSSRNIAIVVLTGTTKWPRVRLQQERIAEVVNLAKAGSYTEIAIPFEPATRAKPRASH
jgi:ActR/RegA family two-component response regulator